MPSDQEIQKRYDEAYDEAEKDPGKNPGMIRAQLQEAKVPHPDGVTEDVDEGNAPGKPKGPRPTRPRNTLGSTQKMIADAPPPHIVAAERERQNGVQPDPEVEIDQVALEAAKRGFFEMAERQTRNLRDQRNQ